MNATQSRQNPASFDRDTDADREAFIERTRKAVLDTLDTLADEMTANRNDGPKDGDLRALFAGIDPIAKRIFDKSQGL